MTARARLCATVTAGTTAELRRRRDAVRGADLLELRLDTVSDPDPAGALAGRRTPVIVTCRAEWEGGGFRGSEEDRRRILREALALGAEYVDIEWSAGFDDLVASAPERVVLSSHDFAAMPLDLRDRLRAMRSTGARVVKLAATPRRLTDVVTLAAARRDAGDQDAVLIAMGEQGLVTRVLPERFGSAWTYAGDLAGVGQLSVAALIQTYRFREVTPAARLYGVFGSPVAHSVSPAMHNASFRALADDAVYLPFRPVDVDDLLTFAGGVRLEGASVTLPFKVPLLERLDEIEPPAREARAVNTLRRSGPAWQGTNTDIDAFLQPLERRAVRLDGVRASVLGAGGAARAVASGLTRRGARVTIHARRQQLAEAVAAGVHAHVASWPPAPGSWDLLVNCTPVGMHPDVAQSPMGDTPLDGRVVYDLIYNPQETRLLGDARRAGCTTIGGLEMLVGQAESQCRWWTGRQPPDGVMMAAALARLSEFTDEHHLV